MAVGTVVAFFIYTSNNEKAKEAHARVGDTIQANIAVNRSNGFHVTRQLSSELNDAILIDDFKKKARGYY